jgi:predicted site-specific integrase-resolvase
MGGAEQRGKRLRADSRDYVSTDQAADLAGVPEGTIRSWASRGKLAAVGTVNGVRYYVAAEVMRVEAATRRRPRLQRLVGKATKDLQR